jgi:hypothetical protein
VWLRHLSNTLTLSLVAVMILPAISFSQEKVGCNQLIEVRLQVPSGWKHPFDSQDIRVDAEMTDTQNHSWIVPCYYHAENDWRLRFSAPEPGDYTYRVSASLQGASAKEFVSGIFTVVHSETSGQIRVHPQNPFYFAAREGKLFYPVGENLAWVNSNEDMGTYLQKLGSNGGNWIRLWMCNWGLTDLEWTNKHFPVYRGLEGYSLENAARIDGIFSKAAEQGIRIQLVINHHGQYATEVNPNWADNPFNVENGGILKDPKEFFTHPEMKRRYKDRLRYLVARWGWSPNLFGWELWNEVNNTDALRKGSPDERRAVLDWHVEIARFLRELDPYNHLITTSGCTIKKDSSEDDTWGLPEFDFNQAHDYVPNLIDRIRGLAVDMRRFKKPFFYGELGISEVNWPNPEEAIPLHDMLWTSVVSPVAGTAMTWYWDNNVDQPNNYFHFAPVRKVVDSIPWANEEFEPCTFLWKSSGEKGVDLVLAPGVGWAKSTVEMIPVDPCHGAPAMGGMSHYLQGLGKPEMRVVPRFSLECGHPIQAVLNLNGASKGGGSVLVIIDGKKAVEAVFPPGENNESREKIGIPLSYTFAIPQGQHEVLLENHGDDWVDLKSLVLEGYSDRGLVMGMKGKNQILVWIRDRKYNGPLSNPPSHEETLQEINVRIPDIPPGAFHLTRWDTRTGATQDLGEVTAPQTELSFTAKEIAKDAFFQFVRKDGI